VPGGRRSRFSRPLNPSPSQVAKVAAAMTLTTGTNQAAMASARACNSRQYGLLDQWGDQPGNQEVTIMKAIRK